MTGEARYRITVKGPAPLSVELDARPGVVPPDGRSADGPRVEAVLPTPADVARGSRRFSVLVDGWYFEAVAEPAGLAGLRDKALRAAAAHQPVVGIALRAQIPGRVVRLWVTEGEDVEQGQRLLAVEAMKMENDVTAHRAGVLTTVAATPGMAVRVGDPIAEIT